jgi:nitrite reductase (NO-forming)
MSALSVKSLKRAAGLIALGAALGLAGPAQAQDQRAAPAQAPGTPGAVADIVRDPTDLPPPIARRAPAAVRVDLETVEFAGKLDDGTTLRYRTFDGKVPGPQQPEIFKKALERRDVSR